MAEEEGVKEQYPVGTHVKYLGGDEKGGRYETTGKIHLVLDPNNLYLVEITTPKGTLYETKGTRYERVFKSNIIGISAGGRKKSHRRKQKSRKHKSRRHVNKRGVSR